MHIVVSIKQVPETSNVRIDEKTGTMIREGVESIVNPLDLYAIETALQLKEAHGGRITVISMGPRSAERAIREAMSMGCDAGALISDPAVAGSDTWATAYVLSRAVARLAPCDLVLCGERATDGDTGQVGPAIASFLDLPVATYASRIEAVTEACRGDRPVARTTACVEVQRLVEAGYERIRLPLPCVITVVKEIGYPRLPTLRGKQRARQAEVAMWSAKDLALDPAFVGLGGSPTRVVKTTKPTVTRKGRVVDMSKVGPDEAARQLADFLAERNLL